MPRQRFEEQPDEGRQPTESKRDHGVDERCRVIHGRARRGNQVPGIVRELVIHLGRGRSDKAVRVAHAMFLRGSDQSPDNRLLARLVQVLLFRSVRQRSDDGPNGLGGGGAKPGPMNRGCMRAVEEVLEAGLHRGAKNSFQNETAPTALA